MRDVPHDGGPARPGGAASSRAGAARRAGYIALALLLAGGALAGCAAPVDESLMRAHERMQAARADARLQADAGGLLTDAERTLNLATEADEAPLRHHYIYMTGKNLDIAEAIAARKRAERELGALSSPAEPANPANPQETARQAAPRQPLSSGAPSGAPPGAPREGQAAETGQDAAMADLRRRVEQERMENAIRQAQAANTRAEELQKTVEMLETRPPAPPVVQSVPEIRFAAGQTGLSPGLRRRLDPLVVRLRDDESIQVLVEGYTDASGNHEANLQTSLARAQAVKDYLIDSGIAADRVQALGLGDRYPIASNDTAAGRRQNRRVEIVLDRAEPGPVTGQR